MNENDDKVLLFTYGSMKKGFCNDYLLEEQTFVSSATTAKKFGLYPNSEYSFPYLFDEKSSGLNIKGELYFVEKEHIKNTIDAVEDVKNNRYFRKEIDVLILGVSMKALIYIANNNLSEDEYDKEFPINEWTRELELMGHYAELYIQQQVV